MNRPVNCRAAQTYWARLSVPNDRGGTRPAALGELTAITVRFATRTVEEDDSVTYTTLDALLDGLPATEGAEGGYFQVGVSKALHEAHMLPLGENAKYYAIWSQAGEFDLEVLEFTVKIGTLQ